MAQTQNLAVNFTEIQFASLSNRSSGAVYHASYHYRTTSPAWPGIDQNYIEGHQESNLKLPLSHSLVSTMLSGSRLTDNQARGRPSFSKATRLIGMT